MRSLFVSLWLFKQVSAYDLPISDWSSDVCSSDLPRGGEAFAENGDGGNIGPFEQRTIALARSIVAEHPGISSAELFQELRPQLVRNRAFMNVDGGYWVLGLQMEAIERADRAELPVDDWAIALASDGFLRLTDMFGRLGVSDLLSINSREEFEEYYSQLRKIGRAHV